MSNKKQVVLLTGASGSMGYEAFKLLWEMRDAYELVLLLRPSKKNRKKFRSYVRRAKVEGGLRIIWGDVLNRQDVDRACSGIDWCLHPLALISPEADRYPGLAEKVNARGTRYIVDAIEAQDPDHIKLVYIGSVAEYGDRLPPVHMGRCGDPLIPSKYDHYALSKMRGELAVMQSAIRHRVSLRQTFIMIPDLFSLKDPIMFHQPVFSLMENITARDSGRLLVNCLEVDEDSAFWKGYYNISGGPDCRTTYLHFLDRIYSMLGMNYRKVMDRNWFALKNFHMQFFEDSERLNAYLQHWESGQSLEDYYKEVWKSMPWYLKVTAWYNKYIPPYKWIVEAATRAQLKKLAGQPDGTLGWVKARDSGRIQAFYGSLEAREQIPSWEKQIPSLDLSQPYTRINHGYDENKEQLELEDLQQSARFRGGKLVSAGWDGDLHLALKWTCYQDHTFELTPHSVLKGGHWCLECISSPWDYELLARQNPFAAQVLEPDVK